MLNRRLLAPALLAAALLPQAARAADAESSVTGQGDATIKKGAEAIRLTVALQVEGSSVHDAVAKLKTRREAVKAALVKLGAADATFDGLPVSRMPSKSASRSRRFIPSPSDGIRTGTACAPSATARMYFSPTQWK